MSAAAGAVYLVLTSVCAWTAMRAFGEDDDAGDLRRIRLASVGLAAFGCAFFIPFYVVGTLELAWRQPRLSLETLLLAQVALVCAVLLVGWLTRGVLPVGRPALPVGPARWTGTFNWKGPAGLVMVGAALAFALMGVLLTFGFPGGYEPRAYHLPIAVNMFQSGTLRTWDHAFMHTFPANMSAYSGFLLQVLPERLVSVANFPFLALACFVVYALARLVGGDASSSQLAAVGLATIPLFGLGALEISADLAGSAFLGLAFILVLAAPHDGRHWIGLAGLCAGVAFGFKSLHLIGSAFLGFIVLALAVAATSEATSHRRLGRAVTSGLWFTCGFALTAGFWLLRNATEFANPLYPVHLGALFDVLGWPKAPDVDYTAREMTELRWVRSPAEWLVYPWVEWQINRWTFKANSGLGAFFAATVPVAWTAALVAVVRRRRLPTITGAGADEYFRVGALLFGSLSIVTLWWLLGDRQPRYAMGAIVLAVPLVAPLLTSLQRRHRRMLEGLAISCIALMLFIITSMQMMEFGEKIIIKKQHSRAQFYKYPPKVDELPVNATVLNLGERTSNYAVFGRRLSNRVVGPLHAIAVLRAAGKNQLTEAELDQLGVSHIFVDGETVDPRQLPAIHPCVDLQELGRISTDRYLYAVNRSAGRCEGK